MHLLEIKALHVEVDGKKILNGLDLTIEPGEVFGYLGPNGAGKSTTIGLLLGLLRPTSGTARVFGLDVWRDAPAAHRRLAYVPSESDLWPSLTGAEALTFLGNVHGSVDTASRWAPSKRNGSQCCEVVSDTFR